MPFSSSVQQPLPSCASSNSLLEFKGGSSSTTTTTTWRTGSWTRSSLLLLRVCVHPAIPLYPSNFFAVHLTSSQSAPGIEIEAALRDLCNCKPSCVVPLSLSLSLSSAFFSWFACLLKNVDLISLEAKSKIRTHSMQDAVPHLGFILVSM
jgi:hypothetical protein